MFSWLGAPRIARADDTSAFSTVSRPPRVSGVGVDGAELWGDPSARTILVLRIGRGVCGVLGVLGILNNPVGVDARLLLRLSEPVILSEAGGSNKGLSKCVSET